MPEREGEAGYKANTKDRHTDSVTLALNITHKCITFMRARLRERACVCVYGEDLANTHLA